MTKKTTDDLEGITGAPDESKEITEPEASIDEVVEKETKVAHIYISSTHSGSFPMDYESDVKVVMEGEVLLGYRIGGTEVYLDQIEEMHPRLYRKVLASESFAYRTVSEMLRGGADEYVIHLGERYHPAETITKEIERWGVLRTGTFHMEPLIEETGDGLEEKHFLIKTYLSKIRAYWPEGEEPLIKR